MPGHYVPGLAWSIVSRLAPQLGFFGKCGTIFGPKIAQLVYNYKMFIDVLFFRFMDVYGVYDFDTSQLDGVSK